MKKGMIWLLAAVMLCTGVCGCVPALAGAPITDYTLEDKWGLQMQGSGFKGHAAFTVEGDAAFGMDESLWHTLKALLSGMTVEVTSMPRSGNRDTEVTVLAGGTQVGFVKVLTDGQNTVVRSDILGEDEYDYQYGAQFDLLRLFAKEESRWPDLKNTLMRLMTADKAWKQEAEPAFSVYTSHLALWMQEYMDVSSQSVQDGYQTRMSCLIPAERVKVQIKRMLSMLYRDEEMLRLLGQVLTKEEQQAYLNPGNQEIFFIMLDLLPMEGDVKIERLYDEKGTALLDEITLPFADVSPWMQLVLRVTYNQAVTTQQMLLSYRDGRHTDVTLRKPDEGTLTGSLRMDLEADENGQRRVRAFQFNFAHDAGEETYDLDQDKCEHLSDLTVLIKPMEEDTTGLRETTLSVRKTMTSKSSRRAATYITVDAALTDQESGSVLALQFACNTASPWTPDMIAGLETEAIVLDDMSGEEVRGLAETLTMNVEGWFTRLLMEQMAMPEEE